MQGLPFENYDEFKELFIREDGKRKNKILLDFLKSKAVRQYYKDINRSFEYLTSMAELYKELCWLVICSSISHRGNIELEGWCYPSPLYGADNLHGICEDGDVTCYRYVNLDSGRVYKMRIGKMFKHLILNSRFGQILPESCILWMCEEVTRNWIAKCSSIVPKYTLVVDDDFESIYSRINYAGTDNFSSCMTNSGQHDFYKYAVKAKAASIRTTDTGQILARCVIFTDVHRVDSDEVLRLAERQYAKNGDDVLKMVLVYALINGGYIDGYKKVGADCHAAHSWMDKHNQPMADTDFYINCELDDGDTLSYQDSFKYYNRSKRIAYNSSSHDYDDELDTTDSTYGYDDYNYDEWHDNYTNSDVITAYYNGRAYTCSEDRLEDFVWVEAEGEYHHVDDVMECPWCHDYFVNNYYSELTEEDYCCEDCLERAERRYKEDNWSWSELCNDYIDPDDEVVFCRWNESTQDYNEYNVTEGYAKAHGEQFNGCYYDTLDHILTEEE